LAMGMRQKGIPRSQQIDMTDMDSDSDQYQIVDDRHNFPLRCSPARICRDPLVPLLTASYYLPRYFVSPSQRRPHNHKNVEITCKQGTLSQTLCFRGPLIPMSDTCLIIALCLASCPPVPRLRSPGTGSLPQILMA
jgi:hypothetical protein